MNDSRARRTAVLTSAAKNRSQAKTRDADQAIRRLVKRGNAITFQAVQREARVSHAFLYNHPELRQRIEHLRAQAQPAPALTVDEDTESALVSVLSQQIAALKKQHRHQITALRTALEHAHGENLDLRRALDRRGSPQPTQPTHS